MNQQINIKLTLTPEMDIKRINTLLNALKNSLGTLGKNITPIDANKLNAELNLINKKVNDTAAGFNKVNTAAKNVQNTLVGVAQKGTLVGNSFSFIYIDP